MHDIDFLPAEYRYEHLRRRRQVWGITVMLTFVGLLAAAAWVQQQRYRKAQEQLDAVLPEYETAVAQSNRLAEIQSELKAARADAELYTYLRHRWPQTQILAALLAPLPDEITFCEVQISEEMPAEPVPTQRRSRTDREAEKEELAKLSPANRDLKQLRSECDPRQTTVSVSGVTSDSAALHHYLGALGQVDLFKEAELLSVETEESDKDAVLRFSATVTVRPGYGQPDGPGKPSKNALAQSHDRTIQAGLGHGQKGLPNTHARRGEVAP